MTPALSTGYCLAPDGAGAVWAFHHAETGRFYPVAALAPPLPGATTPFPRLSPAPLAHLAPSHMLTNKYLNSLNVATGQRDAAPGMPPFLVRLSGILLLAFLVAMLFSAGCAPLRPTPDAWMTSVGKAGLNGATDARTKRAEPTTIR